MKFLGIDYGTKRIGVALSDDGGTLAFPKEIIINDVKALQRLRQIFTEEQVRQVVVGESLNEEGGKNKVTDELEQFVKDLEEKFQIRVHREKEFFTTVEARRYNKEGSQVDASAAALILQRFLDKTNNSPRLETGGASK